MRATRNHPVPDRTIEERAPPGRNKLAPFPKYPGSCLRPRCSDMPTLAIADFGLAKPAGAVSCWQLRTKFPHFFPETLESMPTLSLKQLLQLFI